MVRIRSRPRKGPLPFSYVFVISLVIFVILTSQGLLLVNKGIKPTIMEMAVTRTEQIATEAINDAISKKIVESDLNNMIIIRDNGHVSYDMEIFNRVQAEAIRRVQNYLKKAEEGKLEEWKNAEEIQVEMGDESSIGDGEVAYIPLGQATNIALFSNLGPRIPIRLVPMGSVESAPIFDAERVGINFMRVTLEIDIRVRANVVIPFETKETMIQTTYLLAFDVIEGDVPNFYAPGGAGIQPAIPIDELDVNQGEDE